MSATNETEHTCTCGDTEMWNYAKFAERCSISLPMAKRLVTEGTVPAFRLGNMTRIRPSDAIAAFTKEPWVPSHLRKTA
ncbi:hypothetical protein RCF19_30150 [Rhodococcus qingshengii]